mgnify:CR=1 FL=1
MVSTFHEGEVALQERAGSRAKLAEIGPRVIRDYMPDQHREFFAQLPFVLVGTVDTQGQPWASVLAGEPGFVTSPDPRRLVDRAPLVAPAGAALGTRTRRAIRTPGPALPAPRRGSRRERPGRPAEKVYVSCGVYEAVIDENRSLVPVLQSGGVDVRYEEGAMRYAAHRHREPEARDVGPMPHRSSTP